MIMGNKIKTFAAVAFVAFCVPLVSLANQMQYNTIPYWPQWQGVIGNFGPGGGSWGETFVAPQGLGSVALNDFSLVGECRGGSAQMYLQAFVFQWSGNMIGSGGGAAGPALYFGPTVEYNVGSGWTTLTANFGPSGVSLAPGGHYVVGFTISNPANETASQGQVEFQLASTRGWYPTIPTSVDGGGSAVWDNNPNDPGALNTTTWSTWGDVGDFAYSADFTVPETPNTSVYYLSAIGLALFGWLHRLCGRRPTVL